MTSRVPQFPGLLKLSACLDGITVIAMILQKWDTVNNVTQGVKKKENKLAKFGRCNGQNINHSLQKGCAGPTVKKEHSKK